MTTLFIAITTEWSFILALIIGIGFGYILESAGFSSSRKLAGVFYGYDFVVLRVFFTAAIVAGLGLVYFDYLGWMQMSDIYVNKFYVGSAFLGGAIMGLGFVIGGFCPGTGRWRLRYRRDAGRTGRHRVGRKRDLVAASIPGG